MLTWTTSFPVTLINAQLESYLSHCSGAVAGKRILTIWTLTAYLKTLQAPVTLFKKAENSLHNLSCGRLVFLFVLHSKCLLNLTCRSQLDHSCIFKLIIIKISSAGNRKKNSSSFGMIRPLQPTGYIWNGWVCCSGKRKSEHTFWWAGVILHSNSVSLSACVCRSGTTASGSLTAVESWGKWKACLLRL